MRVLADPVQRTLIVQYGIPANLAQEPSQPRIGLHEPAAESYAVGFVDDAVRVKLVELTKSGLSHQLGVQRGTAIDTGRAHEREMPHPHALAVALIDQRYCGSQHVTGVRIFFSCK